MILYPKRNSSAWCAPGEFLEHARVFGKHWYGTPRRWLDEARRKGLDLVLEIDVQGAEQVKEKLPARGGHFYSAACARKNWSGGCARAGRIRKKRSSAGWTGRGRKCSGTRSTIFWW